MKGFACWGWAAWLVALLALAAGAAANGYPPAPRIIVAAPPGWCDQIAVSVHADRQSYVEGEQVYLTVRTNRDAHIYVFSTDARGLTRQLLPNYFDTNNFVRAHSVKRLPSGRYSLIATGPSGWDSIRVVAVEAGNYWREPECFSGRGSSSNPFPVFDGGYSVARSRLVDSMDAVRSGSNLRVNGRGISVGPPAHRPSWGEGYTSVYVRARCCARYPSCRGNCYRPPACTIHVGCDGSCRNRPPACTIHVNCDGSCGGYGYYDNDDGYSRSSGRLSITSSPAGASVFIDGKYEGKTPFNERVSSGHREVRVERRGYEPWCRGITVRKNIRERFKVSLDREHRNRW